MLIGRKPPLHPKLQDISKYNINYLKPTKKQSVKIKAHVIKILELSKTLT